LPNCRGPGAVRRLVCVMVDREDRAKRRSVERFLLALPIETDNGPREIRDIAMSGLLPASRSRLAVGDLRRLVLTLPGRGSACPPRNGRVRMATPVNCVDGTVGAGIVFNTKSARLMRVA
jgi:hypothetical protein